MRPKSMVLILIALGCGLIASIGISQVVDKGDKEEVEVQLAPVYVAAVDVPVHQKLNAQAVKLEEWPVDRIPLGAVSKFEDLDGRKPSHPLYKGEVILGAKIIDPNSITMTSERIPKGYRVVSVDVDMKSSLSGLLSPGDRVDVLGFFKRRDRPPTTKMILSDISVFAINDRISRATGEEESGTIKAKTVSLTVKPDQAQRLLLATELGQIRLVLRNNDDNSTESPHESNLDDLGPQGLGGLLSGLNPAPPIPTIAAADNTSKFTMEVISPVRMETFRWTDRDTLPEIVKKSNTPSLGGNSNPDITGGEPGEGSVDPNITGEGVQAGNGIGDEIKKKQEEFWSEFQEGRETEKEKLEKAKDTFEKTWNVKIGPIDSVFDE